MASELNADALSVSAVLHARPPVNREVTHATPQKHKAVTSARR